MLLSCMEQEDMIVVNLRERTVPKQGGAVVSAEAVGCRTLYLIVVCESCFAEEDVVDDAVGLRLEGE